MREEEEDEEDKVEDAEDTEEGTKRTRKRKRTRRRKARRRKTRRGRRARRRTRRDCRLTVSGRPCHRGGRPHGQGRRRWDGSGSTCRRWLAAARTARSDARRPTVHRRRPPPPPRAAPPSSPPHVSLPYCWPCPASQGGPVAQAEGGAHRQGDDRREHLPLDKLVVERLERLERQWTRQ